MAEVTSSGPGEHVREMSAREWLSRTVPMSWSDEMAMQAEFSGPIDEVFRSASRLVGSPGWETVGARFGPADPGFLDIARGATGGLSIEGSSAMACGPIGMVLAAARKHVEAYRGQVRGCRLLLCQVRDAGRDG